MWIGAGSATEYSAAVLQVSGPLSLDAIECGTLLAHIKRDNIAKSPFGMCWLKITPLPRPLIHDPRPNHRVALARDRDGIRHCLKVQRANDFKLRAVA